MFVLALSLFFSEPMPLDMPRAEAYLVTQDGRTRLEDRYRRIDLWYSQTVIGRWIDEQNRVFCFSKLETEPPSVGLDDTLTREDYAAQLVPMKRIRANHAYPRAFVEALELLAPCPIAESPRPPRQLPRGFRDVDYWQQPTNYSTVACAFRPEKEESWYLATWELAEGDDYAEKMELFEKRFLRGDFQTFRSGRTPRPERRKPSERELLREDARHSVAAYPNWHFASSEEFVVLDDLGGREFVTALTNEFASMRLKYAAAVPTHIDGSNVLSVARIFASRDEYLDALAVDDRTNMEWSAAYWCPERRELVAHLPAGGEDELLKTLRHEAFHQYLSYAASFVSVSPWLNEGYAQYFEDEASVDWGVGIELTDENLKKFAALLPSVLMMDYDAFYDGSDAERRFKYRLAWSIAVFLEKGADKVRFQPFRKLKGDYFNELFKSQNMQRAAAAALKDADGMKLFVNEWRRFWANTR